MQTIMDPLRRRLSLLFCLLLFYDHRAHSICVPRNNSFHAASPKLSFPVSSPVHIQSQSPPAVVEMMSTNITATTTTTTTSTTQQQSSPPPSTESPKGDTNETSTNTDGGKTPPPPVQTPSATTKSITTDTVQAPTTTTTKSPTEPTNSPAPTPPPPPTTTEPTASPTPTTDSPDSPTPTTDSPDSPTPTTASSIVNPKDSFGRKQITLPFEHHSVLFPSITNLAKPDPAVEKICAKTDYPDLCLASISPFFNGKSDIMSILEISIKACAQYAKVAIAAAKQIINSRVTPAETASILEDCTGMFDDALDNLQNAMNAMAKRDVATINIMLSAAVSDFVTCEDEFEGQRSLLSSYNTKLSNMVANCLAVASMIKV